MRIGIDARFYGLPNGFGRYTHELIDHLSAIDHENTYIIFVLKNTSVGRLPSNFTVRHVSIGWYGWREQLVWPILLYREKLDLMHFLHFNIPLMYRRKFIVTIHDVLLLRMNSAQATTRNRLYYLLKQIGYRMTLRYAISHAAKIIAVSNFTRSELIHFYPSCAHKTSVIYPGVSAFSSHEASAADVHLPEKYFLYSGSCYPHKNVKFLIDGFMDFSKSNESIHLVITGQNDYFLNDLKDYAGKFVNSKVIFLGSLTDAQLKHVYSNAFLYVTTSHYEGFGLPQLEAMSLGVPVLASDIPAFRETLGDSAVYFNQHEHESFKKALLMLCTDERMRTDLIERGRARVRTYDWSLMSQKIKLLYHTT